MQVNYESHGITATAWHNPETNQWRPRLSIFCPPDAHGEQLIKRPLFKTTYATEEEAERAGIAFGQQWIDDNKPDLPEE
jgi:hypothetical protein